MSKYEDKRNVVYVYENRIVIKLHDYNPRNDWRFIENLPPVPQRIRNDEFPFITIKQYIRQMKRSRKKLYNFVLDENKCKFITLSTRDEIDWDSFKYEIEKFRSNLKYKYGAYEYICAVECFCKGMNRYHAHLILIFPNERPSFERDWLKDHWKLGYVHVENSWKNKTYGLVEYITLIDKENKGFTKFPQFARLITTSLKIKKDFNYKMYWTKEQLESFILEVKKCGGNIFYDGHYFTKDKYCLDTIFIHNADEIISKI